MDCFWEPTMKLFREFQTKRDVETLIKTHAALCEGLKAGSIIFFEEENFKQLHQIIDDFPNEMHYPVALSEIAAKVIEHIIIMRNKVQEIMNIEVLSETFHEQLSLGAKE